ncbi:MAG: DUF2190 family protein [Marinibacterium sp.]
MKNYIQRGENLTLAAPAAVTSGDGVLVGSIFGVASGDAENGADVVLSTTGVFELPCPAADDFSVGAAAYWDATAGKATTDDDTGNNPKIGVAVAAAGVGVTTAKVRLNGSF